MNKKLQETLIKKINESVKMTIIEKLILDNLDPQQLNKNGLIKIYDNWDSFPQELINLMATDFIEHGTIDYNNSGLSMEDDRYDMQICLYIKNINNNDTIITRSLKSNGINLYIFADVDYNTYYKSDYDEEHGPYTETICEAHKIKVTEISLNLDVSISDSNIINEFQHYIDDDFDTFREIFELDVEENR